MFIELSPFTSDVTAHKAELCCYHLAIMHIGYSTMSWIVKWR